MQGRGCTTRFYKMQVSIGHNYHFKHCTGLEPDERVTIEQVFQNTAIAIGANGQTGVVYFDELACLELAIRHEATN